jgi:hypothetical protein
MEYCPMQAVSKLVNGALRGELLLCYFGIVISPKSLSPLNVPNIPSSDEIVVRKAVSNLVYISPSLIELITALV